MESSKGVAEERGINRMIYIQTPPSIYKAIVNVLSLFGREEEAVWLQKDYQKFEEKKPRVIINDDEKLDIENSVDKNNEDYIIVKFIKDGVYGSE